MCDQMRGSMGFGARRFATSPNRHVCQRHTIVIETLNTVQFKLSVDVYLFGAEITSVVFVPEDFISFAFVKFVAASKIN